MSLGWFDFLRKLGFGGCLADDMGLGKTVMVLALLEERRRAKDKRPSSLVVAPRSLIFNWKDEAARFAPSLRWLDHSSPAREKEREKVDFDAYDVVLTTYGILQRDILLFKDYRFDYLVLDESQAVKNSATGQASPSASGGCAPARASGTDREPPEPGASSFLLGMLGRFGLRLGGGGRIDASPALRPSSSGTRKR